MKRLLLILALWLLPSAAFAQCNGIFQPNTICGTVAGGPPGQVSTSVLTGVPGGTSGQVQYNSGSNTFAGFTVGGDCTVVVASGVFTCLKTNGVSFGSGATSLGTPANVLNTKTLPYTVLNTDCQKTINIAGGPGTLTLPGVSGFDGKCTVQVCNTAANDNTTHAVILAGFPNQSLPHLWMQQCETVDIVNGVWIASSLPGKFHPVFQVKIFIDPGGNASNDGLVSNAASNAITNLSQCFAILQSEMDLANVAIPICAPTGGAVFTEASLVWSAGGNGTKVIYVIGQGGSPAVLRTSNNVVIELSDFAGYIIFSNMIFDCTGAGSHPCYGLFIHQQNGIDLASSAPATVGNQFIGADAGDVGIWCDSFCKINSAAAVTMTGTFADMFKMDEHSVLTLNTGVIVDNGASAANIFKLSYNSSMIYAGQLVLGSGNSINQVVTALNNSEAIFATFTLSGSIGGGGRQWAILNNSLLCNASAVAIPGSAGINTAATYAAGVIVNAGVSGTCTQ